MRIGIEANALTREQRTGVDYYTLQLLTAMAKARPEYAFELGYFFFRTKSAPHIGLSSVNVKELRNSWLPSKVYALLFRCGLAPAFDALLGKSYDFFLFPNFVRWPLARSSRSGVVIYDLSFIYSPSTMTRRLRSFLARKVPASISRSDLVVTISETVREEIIKEYRVDPRKIFIAYPAIDRASFFPRSEQRSEATLAAYGLRWRSFILFVGTIEPRKNIERLFEAYEKLSLEITDCYPLVIVGGKGWMDKGIYEKLAELLIKGLDIRMLGYVPHERLPCLYSSASVFVFPSLYEGFGMPILEAMACGAPVITSSSSSMPEVVGEAGVLIDPEDSSSLAIAIEALLRDNDRAERLRMAGIKRSESFSWEKSATIVLDAIEANQGRDRIV